MNEGLIYLYGALPHTPHAFLKKAWEKAFFADKYPAHFIRAILVGAILYSAGTLLFLMYAVFGVPIIILGFIGYAKQKKINQSLL